VIKKKKQVKQGQQWGPIFLHRKALGIAKGEIVGKKKKPVGSGKKALFGNCRGSQEGEGNGGGKGKYKDHRWGK